MRSTAGQDRPTLARMTHGISVTDGLTASAGVLEGSFVSWDLPTYCGLFSGSPAEDEDRRRRRVEALHITETVATATMTLWHGPDTFTDAFVLLRVDGRWWIANKVYERR